MEKVFKYGKMVLFMKDFGRMIKLMVKEDSYMQMEIFMKVIGLITNHRALVFICIKTVLDMRENG